MPDPPRRRSRLDLAAASVAAMVVLYAPGEPKAAPSHHAIDDASPAAADAAALVAAQDRSARAAGLLEALKRASAPGHLLDPLPSDVRIPTLDGLRADYLDLEARAAGYRATLGDRHPTLMAAEQVMADLRIRMLAAIRTALSGAQAEDALARADETAIAERIRLRSRAEATGSLRGAGPAMPVVDDAALGRADKAAPASAAPRPSEPRHVETAARRGAIGDGAAAVPTGRPTGIALMGLLALLLVSWIGLRLGGRRRGAAVPRIEPALLARGARSTAPARTPTKPSSAGIPPVAATGSGEVPVLATLALASSLAEVVDDVTLRPAGGSARAAAGIHTTLRRAFVPTEAEAPMTVLVSPMGMPPGQGADAAVLALALAAAGAGRRVLLIDTRGGIRAALMPDADPLCLVDHLGAPRPLYRLAVAGLVAAVLSGDPPGPDDAVAEAGTRPRRRGLTGFDTIIVAGAGIEADAGLEARRADLVLVAAPEGTAPADLAAAARRLQGVSGRPCGALLVAAPVEEAAAPKPSATVEPLSLRRRRTGDPAPIVSSGPRRLIGAPRRRIGA